MDQASSFSTYVNVDRSAIFDDRKMRVRQHFFAFARCKFVPDVARGDLLAQFQPVAFRWDRSRLLVSSMMVASRPLNNVGLECDEEYR